MMITLDVNHDAMLWTPVPLEYPFGPYANKDDWADAVADAYSVGTTDPAAIRDSLVAYAAASPPSPGKGYTTCSGT